jgi:phenylacetate-CoA ligase
VPPFGRDAWRDGWRGLIAAPDTVGLTLVRSSGSTAAPVPVWRDPADRDAPYRVMRFAAERLGRPLPDPFGVWFVDRLPGDRSGRETSIRRDGGTLWRSGPGDDLADAPAADVISTDPRGLAALLEVAVPAPRIAWSSATALSASLRAATEAHLHAPVVDAYGATETGPIALSCPRFPGRWHVLTPDVHVDEVDGELVITRLRDSAMPVLRWRSGDRGRVRTLVCPCGAHGPVIESLRGREVVSFVRPDGRTVDAWLLAPALRPLSLRAVQVVQRTPAGFELYAEGEVEAALLAVYAALRRLGWAEPHVHARDTPCGTEKLPFAAMSGATAAQRDEADEPPGPHRG